MKNTLPKIIVIVGPTASGKTDLSLALAKKYNGEIVSADSRQVYKKMDIGTAKPVKDFGLQTSDYIVQGIRHHLMDMVNPDANFSLADFKKAAIEAVRDILQRGKLPIVVGGTGLYIWALLDNLDIPKVQPDSKLRKELESKSLAELVRLLQEKDQASARKIDLKNPRRVIRALEVVLSSGESFIAQQTKSEPIFTALQIGLKISKEELYRRIDERIDRQIADGLVEEVTKLVSEGYSWDLPSMSGIGYKEIGQYFRGEVPLAKAIEILKTNTYKYAKRQLTWFKRDARIQWIGSNDLVAAQELAEEFLK